MTKFLMGVLRPIVAVCVIAQFPARSARADDEGDESIELEFGGAGEVPINGGRTNFGGTIGVQVTPIENWLELELDGTALGTNGHTELEAGFLFEKPFRLSQKVELEIGVGPSVSRVTHGPEKDTEWSIEFSAQFNFWTFKNKHIAWYVEPSWSIAPGSGEKSVGMSAGLRFGL